jgi:hypothetical protein
VERPVTSTTTTHSRRGAAGDLVTHQLDAGQSVVRDDQTRHMLLHDADLARGKPLALPIGQTDTIGEERDVAGPLPHEVGVRHGLRPTSDGVADACGPLVIRSGWS